MIKVMKKLRRDNGSITVEATVVFPVFLLFIFFLVSLIRMSLFQITLDHVVGDTTKEIATHYYVVDLAKSGIENVLDKKGSNGNETVYITDTGKKYHKDDCRYLWNSEKKTTILNAVGGKYTPCSVCDPPVLNNEKPSIKNKVDSVLDKIPEPMREFLVKLVKDKTIELVDSALKDPIKNLMLASQPGQAENGLLRPEHLNIKEVKLAEGEDITIHAEYLLSVPSPLGTMVIHLESRGMQKTWK